MPRGNKRQPSITLLSDKQLINRKAITQKSHIGFTGSALFYDEGGIVYHHLLSLGKTEFRLMSLPPKNSCRLLLHWSRMAHLSSAVQHSHVR